MKTASIPCLPRTLLMERIFAVTAVCVLTLSPIALRAADATWTGATDGNWSVDTNWSGTAPGSTTVTNNADTATFNADPSNKAITIDANRNIRNITFDTASAGSYTFGGNTLKLSSGGTMLMTADVADGVTQTFNNAISFNGNYTISNLDAGTAKFVFAGGMTAASNSTVTFYTNDTTATTTINTISGNLANGTGVLTVSFGNFSSGNGRGRYEMTGANSYTGATTINFRGGAVGSNGELITSGTNSSGGAVNLSRGTLTLNNTTNGGISSGLMTMGAGSFLRANIAGAGTLANNVKTNNSTTITGDHNITINGTFTNATLSDRPLTNSIVSGQKLTLNGDVYLSDVSGTGRVWQLRGSGETLINGDISDFSGGKGTAAGGIDFNTSAGGARSLTLAGTNTYSGNTLLGGGASTIFNLADTGSMTFYVGANGINNQITGSATANFNGSFNFDLTGADLTDGNSWNIVDVATVIESFAGSFSVSGFTESGNVWSNGAGFSFNEATGILSYSAIPEPSTYALLVGAAGLMLGIGRRARRAS